MRLSPLKLLIGRRQVNDLLALLLEHLGAKLRIGPETRRHVQVLDVELAFFRCHLERLPQLLNRILLVNDALRQVITQQLLQSLRLLVL